MPEKLPLLFSEAFEAPIWEMHHSDSLLLIATRDEARLSVSFSLFDLKSISFLWKEIQFEEPWWIGTTHFHGHTVVFHTYENDQNFEKKSIFGFDINRQEVTWAAEDYQPKEAFEGLLLCSNGDREDQQQFWINCETGEIVDEPEESSLNKKDSFTISNLDYAPLHYVEGSAAFDTVARYLQLKLGRTAIGACDYLEMKEHVVISFFEDTEDGKKNSIVVLDAAGDMKHMDVLASGLEGLAADTFFIANEALIFVKNRSLLNGFSIGN